MPSTLPSHLGLIILRAIYFLGCRRYVHRSLLSDLRQVIRDDSLEPADPIELNSDSDEESMTAGFTNWFNKSSSSSAKHDSLPIRAPKRSSPALKSAPSISAGFTTFLFCWSFCEGSLLFSIVILGSWLDTTARNLNWNLSLGLLIASVVYVFPLAECLLFATSVLSRKAAERPRLLSARTVGLTLVPFLGYLFLYYRVGQTIQGLLGVETGSHSFGFLNTTLARICVPGVFLIASLSGGAAVNTAWETWEWRRRDKEPPITDQHIASAEQALHRTRMDLQTRRAAASQSAEGPSSSGIMSLLTGTRSSQLQLELSGVEALERQMTADLTSMKQRKAFAEYSRTLPGILLNCANWTLSVYCIYRLFMACVNLIFGYVRPTGAGNTGNARSPTTDVVTYLLARVLGTFQIELDLSTLSRLVGLVLIGSIIVVNLRASLVWVHRAFSRLGSGGLISTPFMLLILGQLMAMYLLTCLISLPSASSSTRPDDLLSTLPSFHLFSRLFDIVFLVTGIVTGLIRWLAKQILQTEDQETMALNRITV
ncbi:Abscisic acid G-protein coupled receptor-domain-containing protein [Melampsora americana]|nr:Abscisic acid G-protein coupled receptor-domain-containing protein [Melampsora americana]